MDLCLSSSSRLSPSLLFVVAHIVYSTQSTIFRQTGAAGGDGRHGCNVFEDHVRLDFSISVGRMLDSSNVTV